MRTIQLRAVLLYMFCATLLIFLAVFSGLSELDASIAGYVLIDSFWHSCKQFVLQLFSSNSKHNAIKLLPDQQLILQIVLLGLPSILLVVLLARSFNIIDNTMSMLGIIGLASQVLKQLYDQLVDYAK